jgi:aminobenzoyl-glutamate utilization protein A
MEKTIREMANALQPELIRLRRDLHRFPEAGWTEFRTAALIANELTTLDYRLKLGERAVTKTDMLGVPSAVDLSRHRERALSQGADPRFVNAMEGGLTGIVADLNPGVRPLIALRFDIDANDIDESCDPKHRPYLEGFSSANPGVMHACGHDGHTAIGIGVARILSAWRERLQGSVRLIFEPGEEGSRGARAMASAGAVDGVDYILGFHIGMQARKTGQLICGTGNFLAATKYDVTYTGMPAHAGAAPEQGRNALLAAACAALSLHGISRHGKGISRINVGTLVAGQGRNVIPANALFKIETRGETTEIDEYMAAEARRIVIGAAQMYGVECHIQHLGSTRSGESSPALRERIRQVAQKLDCFSDIVDYASFGATEDFSLLMTMVQSRGGQGDYFMLGADMSGGHHTNYFDFEESILAKGVQLAVAAVFDLMSS